MSIPTRGLIYFAGSQSGTSLLSGNGAPNANAGGPGDFYLDLTDAVLYGPKDASTGWPASGIDFSGVANAEGPLVFDPETQTLSLDPIATSDIQDDAITSAKIADNAVGNSELASDSVDTAEIVDGAVTEAKLDTGVSDLLLPVATEANYGHALIFTPGGPAWFQPSIAGVEGLTEALADKADLDENGKLLTSQLPALAISDVYTAADAAAVSALPPLQEGDVVIRTDESKSYIYNGENLVELKTPTDAVLSVNGQTGAVELTYSDVGAAAAVHTHSISDITDLQSELDGKSDVGHTHTKSDITDFSDADYAPASHTHVKADITDFDEADYAAADHTHDVDDLQDASKRLVPEGGQPGQALVYGAEPFWATPIIAGVDGLQAALDSKQTKIERTTVVKSVTCAAGSEVSVDIELSKSYMLTKIESTKPARIRLYQSSDARTADQSRASTTPPSTQGLVAEVIMDSELVTSGLLLNPPQLGYNASNSATTKALVANQGESADLQLTLTYLKIEE